MNGITRSWFILIGIIIWVVAHSAAGEDAKMKRNSTVKITPEQVDIMVVGCAHLRYLNPADKPVTSLVLGALEKYQPDHVAVEWLHPGIDQAPEDLYQPLGDLNTLAGLWGYDPAGVETALVETRKILDTLKEKNLPDTAMRIELGKLHYLSRDQLNAGYQWWTAHNSGAEVTELKRLTQNNFQGHELEVFGFAIARKQGLEYITPFDYQGKDAEWDFGAVINRTLVLAIERKHGLKEGDAGFDDASENMGKLAQAWLDSGDGTFLEQYGDIKEVKELANFFEHQKQSRKRDSIHKDLTGIAAMRFKQSPEFLEDERSAYYDVIAGLSIDGLGRKLVENFELRNRHMADFLEQDIRQFGSRRVMVIVGAGHKLFLEEILRKRGYHIVPSLEFLPEI